MKRCTKCGVESDDFSPNARHKDGLQSYCRPCRREYDRDRYVTNDEYRKRRRQSTKLINDSNRERMRQYKATLHCVDCGNNDPRVFEFDHIGDDKTRDVSEMASYSWSRIMEEVAKCDVVCANCHRIRTWERANQI